MNTFPEVVTLREGSGSFGAACARRRIRMEQWSAALAIKEVKARDQMGVAVVSFVRRQRGSSPD